MSPPSRRALLASAGTLIPVSIAGCLSGEEPGVSTPSETDTIAASTSTGSPPEPTPCEALYEGFETTGAGDCPAVEITYVSAEPRTPKPPTSEEGTTIAGSGGDDVVVEVRVGGDDRRTLVGCIESVNDGKESISKRLDARDEEYRLEFGPYGHHGVERVVVWIEGCHRRVDWP